MDRIRNAIKCATCREILESPVILPCSDTICKKHVTNQTNDLIRCEKCGIEHSIPTNGFPTLPFLEEIIKSEIGQLDFGNVHKEAKMACESVENALKGFEVLLKDPYFYTHERISELKNIVQLKGEELKNIVQLKGEELKNIVQLKGEELKLRIDEEMTKLIGKLGEYERQSKEYLSSNEFKVESKKFHSELKTAHTKLDSWHESLNKIKLDEEKWKGIKEECEQKLKSITEESEKFKNKLLLNKFEENQNHVNCFKSITIDSIFDKVSVKRDITMLSKIINTAALSQNFEELLKKKDLNGRKWSLLYQGSRNEFRSSDFHSRCDNKPNTLTIVKSTSGNIFGGFTSAQWSSPLIEITQFDKSAFIFSLVNKEKRKLIFEQSSNENPSTCSFKHSGPIFGDGYDLFISNCSNKNRDSYSNLGHIYTHPDYEYGSEKAITILAGSFNFQVQEIEVFQMQQ